MFIFNGVELCLRMKNKHAASYRNNKINLILSFHPLTGTWLGRICDTTVRRYIEVTVNFQRSLI
jgi:hypothetical protein